MQQKRLNMNHDVKKLPGGDFEVVYPRHHLNTCAQTCRNVKGHAPHCPDLKRGTAPQTHNRG